MGWNVASCNQWSHSIYTGEIMGTFNHHVLVVVGQMDEIRKAHAHAINVYPYTSNIVNGGFNGFGSFMLGCDGSKEGWEYSDAMQVIRSEFIKWILENKLPLQYSLISFHESLDYPILENSYPAWTDIKSPVKPQNNQRVIFKKIVTATCEYSCGDDEVTLPGSFEIDRMSGFIDIKEYWIPLDSYNMEHDIDE